MKEKLEKLKSELLEAYGKSKDPVICFSGGKDSAFLWFLSRYLGYNVPVIMFGHFWTEHQKQYIKQVLEDYQIFIMTYRPHSLMFSDGDLVAYYNIGNNLMPVIFEHFDNASACGLDICRKSLPQEPIPFYIWDTTILGSKATDAHKSVKQPVFTDFISVTDVLTPLYDWTDEEVLEAIDDFGFPIDERVYVHKDLSADTGHFTACMRCVNAPDKVLCPKTDTKIDPFIIEVQHGKS